MSNSDKMKDNPYDTDNLQQSTIDLLDDDVLVVMDYFYRSDSVLQKEHIAIILRKKRHFGENGLYKNIIPYFFKK